MSRGVPPMPSPAPEISVQVYLPRIALDRISAADMRAAAQRIGYDGPLRWEASVHDLPAAAPAGSVRLTCLVAEAFVFLECFCDLVETADPYNEHELVEAFVDALTTLYNGIELALKDYQ